MNQASVWGGLAEPNSAVPVLPNVPAGRPAPAAVPCGVVTTACIMERRSDTTAGSSACAGAVSSADPVTSRGSRRLPEPTDAATVARASGETTTCACPIAVAAASEVDVGVGTLPLKAVNPSLYVTPMPYRAAAVA